MAYSVGFVASAARTTNGNSAALLLAPPADSLNVAMFVTAVSGTPNLVLSIEWSNDGTTFAPAETADAFTAVTTTGNKVKQFAVKGPYARVVWVITGTTPSLTFSVDVGSSARPVNVAYG